MMNVPKILRELREDHDLYQKQVAGILNITPQQYQLYESGQRSIPYPMIYTLSLYYHVSADYILGLPEGLPYPKR